MQKAGGNLKWEAGAAVCCTVLHCGVLCCSVWQGVAEGLKVKRGVAACCSVLQCVAVCCKCLKRKTKA